MSKDNPISTAYNWYTQHGPSPLATAGIVALLAYAKNRALWGPSVETLRSLGRPIGRGVYGNTPEGDAEWNAAMDDLKNNSKARRIVPAAFALMAGGGLLGLMADPGKKNWGLTSWNAPSKPIGAGAANLPATSLFKTASYLTDSYVDNLDWSKPVNGADARRLFTNDPWLKHEPYVRHLGGSIVTGASLESGSRNPTLGSIFDNAVGKLENKLTWSGVTDMAVKSAVANGAARLFTGALDAMVGLDPRMRQSLVDAGTWAGAITSILD